MSRGFGYFLSSVLITVSFAACSGTEVTTNLKRVTSAGATSALQAIRRQFASGDVTSDVTIESYKIPILDVSLGLGDALTGGSGNANTLYQCPAGTPSGCMVELNGTSLENLLTTAGANIKSIDPGTYTSVMIGTCTTESTYNAEIKASVTFKGQTYYTKADSEYLTTDSSQYGVVNVPFNSCRNYSVLDTPITIGDTNATVDLFIDLRNIINVSNIDGPTLYNKGSCTRTSAPDTGETDPYLCGDYPNVTGTINTTSITLERYRVEPSTGDGTAARLIGLYFDGDGTPVGGFARLLFNSTTYNDVDIIGSFKRVYKESDMLYVTDYGETDTITGNGDKTIKDFPRLSVGAEQDSVVQVDGNGTATGTLIKITRLD